MLQAILSSHTQFILNPPVHFSTLKVQRGTIIQLPAGIEGVVPIPGVPVGIPPIPGMPMLVRSIIIVLDIADSSCDLAPPWRDSRNEVPP
jgi:hypothetical protein